MHSIVVHVRRWLGLVVPKTNHLSEVGGLYASECCGELVVTPFGYPFPPCSICDHETAYVLLTAARQGEFPLSA